MKWKKGKKIIFNSYPRKNRKHQTFLMRIKTKKKKKKAREWFCHNFIFWVLTYKYEKKEKKRNGHLNRWTQNLQESTPNTSKIQKGDVSVYVARPIVIEPVLYHTMPRKKWTLPLYQNWKWTWRWNWWQSSTGTCGIRELLSSLDSASW